MYFARSENESGERQLLADHLRNVGELAGKFAEEAGLPREMGEWAGWLHDLGKYSQEFQEHLRKKDDNFVEHAAHGAAVAVSAGAIECAFAVAAHHSGLGTGQTIRDLRVRDELTAGLAPGIRISARAEEFRRLAEQDAGITGQPARTIADRGDEAKLELRTRMLLSCVADADRLDAERWMSQWKSDMRIEAEPLDPAGRLEHTLAHIATIAGPKPESVVKAARASVLRDALARAADAPGFFSLTVPTGGGKTLASLAFGLEHARRHGHRRLLYVLPFLTIIEQNAAVIRAAVGETDDNAGRVVLEHHSNVVFERDDKHRPTAEMQQSIDEVRQRLLAENWDAPVVVTTTVQFFESLFAAHPTAVRKIHNIPRSVIILDEAQTFPPGMLRPIVAMLRQLVDEYGCTVLFTTATQPALRQPLRMPAGQPEPLLEPGTMREIVTDPPALFRDLKRVDVAWPGPQPTPMASVAVSMAGARQALAIVNTKQQARELWEALRQHDERAIHLSTRMCAAHRRTVFADVRSRLGGGEPCLVASTQLIEAGVDVDFPAVWRALGPLEGVAQAAGRCNREGILATGRVTVFRTEDGRMPGGAYASATTITAGMLERGTEPDIDAPGTFEEYFQDLYNVLSLDEKDIASSRRELQFPDTADHFRIIDEATVAVLVPYGEGAAWIARIQASEELSRGQLRRLQPYTVALYPHELHQGIASGDIRLDEKTGIHLFGGDYDDALGLVLGGGALQD